MTITGIVFNLKTNKVLKGWVNRAGLRCVKLYNKEGSKVYLVHRLVAAQYKEGFEEKLCVVHKSDQILDNSYTNLEVLTKSEVVRRYLKEKKE